MVLKVKQVLYSGLNFASEKMIFAQITLNRGLFEFAEREKSYEPYEKRHFLKTFTVF